MHHFHDKYQICFLRLISKLRAYRIISEVVFHQHPEFDFNIFPPLIKRAIAQVRSSNPELLNEAVDYLNSCLQKRGVGSRIKITDWGLSKYNLTISPDYSTHWEEWMNETEKAICSFNGSLEDFFMKRKKVE